MEQFDNSLRRNMNHINFQDAYYELFQHFRSYSNQSNIMFSLFERGFRELIILNNNNQRFQQSTIQEPIIHNSYPRRSFFIPTFYPNSNTSNSNSNNNQNNQNRNNNSVPSFRLNRNENQNGLSSEQISQNSELVIFHSIQNPLNTECPISREEFTSNSIVLRLHNCGHCFTPFNILSWLRQHNTCPLCRGNIIRSSSTINQETQENSINSNENNNNNNNNTRNSVSVPPIASLSNRLNNYYQNLIQNSQEFNNLNIDGIHDNEIVFSFDLPIGNINNPIHNTNDLSSYISSLLEPNSSSNESNN